MQTISDTELQIYITIKFIWKINIFSYSNSLLMKYISLIFQNVMLFSKKIQFEIWRKLREILKKLGSTNMCVSRLKRPPIALSTITLDCSTNSADLGLKNCYYFQPCARSIFRCKKPPRLPTSVQNVAASYCSCKQFHGNGNPTILKQVG